ARNSETSARLAASAPFIFQLPAIKGLRTRSHAEGLRRGRELTGRCAAKQRARRPAAWRGGRPAERAAKAPALTAEREAHGLRELPCQRVDLLVVLPFDHDADDR